ncbi:MAG TPA: hypothetical protein VM328_10275 [Fimbriimonadaceae bacterium]|nr:hypothetical protein [Fimbriimonadaceae bacterium]
MKGVVIVAGAALLVGGGLFGAAKAGMIDIPGVSPKKAAPKKGSAKEAKATDSAGDAKLPGESKPLESTAPEPKPSAAPAAQAAIARALPPPAKKPKVESSAVKLDPELGEKKLAKLWNSIPPDALLKIAQSWKPSELAGVLAKMDQAKVATLLSQMDPKRASEVSREIKRVASRTQPEG